MATMRRWILLLPVMPLLASPAAAQSGESTLPSDVSGQDGNLSRKLNNTSGVIHPDENVDPGMQKVPPVTGKMPVVPPPGTPGGESNVVPK